MADFLIHKLQDKYTISYLSRGYQRKTSGFLLAKPQHNVDDIGDEAFQIFSKWHPKIALAVDENRRNGIENILKEKPETNLIILDDAMQHRRVKATVNIMLTPSDKPFFQNCLFPAGSLRDIPSSAKRADIVVFTKGKQANAESYNEWKSIWMKKNWSSKPFFVSSLKYLKPVNHSGIVLDSQIEVVSVAGLASNMLFFTYCKENFNVIKCISKADHYRYLEDFFIQESLEDKTILTTEKDFHKLLSIAPNKEKIFYIPLQIKLFPETSFLETIENKL